MALHLHLKYLGTSEASRQEEIIVDVLTYTIGRSASNDLRLADREKLISGQHALISQSEDGYYLTDKSTNGVLLNGKLVAKDTEAYLRQGDELRISDYQLVVTSVNIESGGDGVDAGGLFATEKPFSDPLDALGDASVASRDPFAQAPDEPQPVDPLDLLLSGESADPFAELDKSVPPIELGGQSAAAAGGPMEDFIEQPLQRAPSSNKPEDTDLPDWAKELVDLDGTPAQSEPYPAEQSGISTSPRVAPDSRSTQNPADMGAPLSSSAGAASEPFTPSPADVRPTPATSGRQAPSAASNNELAQALLQGLNLESTHVDPQFAQLVGVLLRTLLQGVIEMLHARSEFKNSMRLSRTMIQAQDNNPFKVAMNADDLIDLLLVNPRRGYLSADQAVDETIADLGTHELAVLDGLRTIGRDIAKMLDPKTLEAEFSRKSTISGALGLMQKSKYWEAFEAFHSKQLADGELVTDTFARVYDEALQQLKRGL